MSIWGIVLQPLADAFKSWNDGRTKIKEAKINAEVARYNAEAAVAEKKMAIEADWDIRALEASKNSWKDEFILIIIAIPYVLVWPVVFFWPEKILLIHDVFTLIADFPLWWQSAFLGIVAASFGLRWWFNREKISVIRQNGAGARVEHPSEE